MDDLIRTEKSLQAEIEDCGKKLIRAEKMISGLEGEKVRWTETVKLLGERQTLLVGDCLVAAGMVSYAGPIAFKTIIFQNEFNLVFQSPGKGSS